MHDGEIDYPMGEPTFERPTLLSSCALATSAAEARFRVPYPNARPRLTRVIALDGPAQALVSEAQARDWAGAQFYALAPRPAAEDQGDVALVDCGGAAAGASLRDLIRRSDAVVMVATSEAGADQARAIGALAQDHNVMAVALIVADQDARRALEPLTAALRPAAGVLVICDGGCDYLVDMLTALRA